MKNKKLIGSAIFVAGALVAIKNWNSKPVKGSDVQPTEGGTTWKGLGIIAAVIGAVIVFKSKNS